MFATSPHFFITNELLCMIVYKALFKIVLPVLFYKNLGMGWLQDTASWEDI